LWQIVHLRGRRGPPQLTGTLSDGASHAKVDVSSADPATLRKALFGSIRTLFPGLRDEELPKLAAAFGDKPSGFLNHEELSKEGLSGKQLRRRPSGSSFPSSRPAESRSTLGRRLAGAAYSTLPSDQ